MYVYRFSKIKLYLRNSSLCIRRRYPLPGRADRIKRRYNPHRLVRLSRMAITPVSRSVRTRLPFIFIHAYMMRTVRPLDKMPRNVMLIHPAPPPSCPPGESLTDCIFRPVKTCPQMGSWYYQRTKGPPECHFVKVFCPICKKIIQGLVLPC